MIAAQSTSRFSYPAMIKLAWTFVTAVGVVCSNIHYGQKAAYSLNASLRSPVIKKDFTVDEYSPKYSVSTTSVYMPISELPPSGKSKNARTASVDSLSTSTCAKASSKFAHGVASATRK
jgi:hypothetical protein